MAVFLRDTPIKRKLMLVILLTSGFALFLLGSALITYELLTFRRSQATNMKVLAEIIGANSTVAISFQDPHSGQEILRALSAERQVTKAAIYDQNGDLFARFPPGRPVAEFPRNPRENGYRFTRTHLSLVQPIWQDGIRLGKIFLQADLGEMYSRFTVYGLLLLFVGAASSLGAIALTTTLQRRITVPILELAKVAGSVSDRADYSARAIKHGNDEIGQLTDAFNRMLMRIGESSAALAASEERLRLALEGSRTGTWDWNIQTGHITWDDYMYPLYGRGKKDFDGRIESFLQMVYPDDRVLLDRATQFAIAGKKTIDVDFRIVDLDGSIRHMASRGRVFYDESGKAVRMSGVNMDITATKKDQEELSRAKEAAEAANQAKDDFLAILSHELRTPLTPVLAAVSMLEEDQNLSPEIMDELEMIRRNIEVEAHLIDDLLDVTGIIRGKLELTRQPVDVRPLIEHAMQNYCAGAAMKKNLRVSIKITAAETHVLGDSSRMTQVFWNLMQNACKFTPSFGSIDVHVFNEPTRPRSGSGEEFRPDLVVEITDSGIGISPDHMLRIFNAFEQGERSRTRVFGGLGLGLAISRAIIELHGGAITASSDGQNRGAKFTVRLRTVASVPAESLPRTPGAATSGPVSSRSLRVLLVEDHRDTANQLTRLLQRAGHDVTWAGSLREARGYIAATGDDPEAQGFNILISDLGLPDGSGHDLMRDLASRQAMPGIALSGYGMKDDILDSMAAGFSRHITKPVDWQELKLAIQKIAADQEA
jgi:signal transduction histidine kinase/ActR/RegA family two-component response regulator